jgi:hypothetical protein
MKLVEIGKTGFGQAALHGDYFLAGEHGESREIQKISQKLAHAEGVTEEQARQLARDGKAIVWIDGGLHASESVGSQQLMERSIRWSAAPIPKPCGC